MCGGILIDPGGKTKLSYVWGLGILSNNHAEVYAFLQGSHMTLEYQIHSLIMVGDLSIII